MQQLSSCFDKVKKDCLKFIKSQETSKEKFSNKEGMLKSFLIPMCFSIAKKANNKKPYFVLHSLTNSYIIPQLVGFGSYV